MRALFLTVAGMVTLLAVACSHGNDSPVTATPPPSTTFAPTATAKPAPTNTAEADDIREAVFRFLFDHNASGQQSNVAAYFISFGQSHDEPPAGFIARFDGNVPVVKPPSEAIISYSGVTDIVTGELGLLFNVGEITMTDSDTATVNGGYYEEDLSGSDSTFTVERQGGVWVVTDEHLNSIS